MNSPIDPEYNAAIGISFISGVVLGSILTAVILYYARLYYLSSIDKPNKELLKG
jgi:hypothetical protein